MIVVLTGAPGAGKGTQAELLAKREGYRKLSTGDALRKHVKEGTEVGKVAAGLMARGLLVPDDVLFGIIRAELTAARADEVILLDGYPRNLDQAAALESLRQTQAVKGVVQLDVPREELIQRLSGRRVCGGCGATYHVVENPPQLAGRCDKCGQAVTQRVDDNPDSVAVRLDVYTQSTRPILDYYGKKGLVKLVKGSGDLEAIYKDLKSVIQGL